MFVVEPCISFIYKVLVLAYHVVSEQALSIQGVGWRGVESLALFPLPQISKRSINLVKRLC